MSVIRWATMKRLIKACIGSFPVRVVHLPGLSLAIGMFLAGCQSPPADEDAPLPVKVPDPQVDMQSYQLPDTLGDLRLVGDAQREGGPGRLFFYQAPDSDRQARVTLYPLAGGWDTLPPERAVAGQYGVIRQQLLSRLSRRNYGVIESSGEGLYESENSPYPVAAVILRSGSHADKPAHLLMLGVSLPVFVRVEREMSPASAQETAAETREWLERLIQSL